MLRIKRKFCNYNQHIAFWVPKIFTITQYANDSLVVMERCSRQVITINELR
jgi:hypothetical protein